MVYLAFNNSFESPPSSAARGDARQASRGGKHEGRKRVVYRSSDFFSISFFFSNFPSPPFNLCRFAVSSSVYSKRAILESGTGKQVTRKFCDVPEKRLTSPRDIRTRKFLLFSNLSLSLSRTVKDIFVEHRLLRALSPRCFARFRDTLVEKLDARRATKERNGKNFCLQLLANNRTTEVEIRSSPGEE